MKKLTYIFIFVLSINCSSQTHLGKAIINNIYGYEEDDNYFPHDFLMPRDSLCNKEPVSISIENDKLVISNRFNTGLSGHIITFKTDRLFNIISTEYSQWTDMILDGVGSKTSVEKVILTLNKNPFLDSLVTGKYSLQIKTETYNYGKDKDTIIFAREHSIFKGKFKIYNNLELTKSKKWVLDKELISSKIKDSVGIMIFPDILPQYKYGNDSLVNILKAVNLKANKLHLQFVIDEFGAIDSSSIKPVSIYCSIDSSDLKKIKKELRIWSNWFPAIYNKKRVKTIVSFKYIPNLEKVIVDYLSLINN